jgi:hypothetical protein
VIAITSDIRMRCVGEKGEGNSSKKEKIEQGKFSTITFPSLQCFFIFVIPKSLREGEGGKSKKKRRVDTVLYCPRSLLLLVSVCRYK